MRRLAQPEEIAYGALYLASMNPRSLQASPYRLMAAIPQDKDVQSRNHLPVLLHCKDLEMP